MGDEVQPAPTLMDARAKVNDCAPMLMHTVPACWSNVTSDTGPAATGNAVNDQRALAGTASLNPHAKLTSDGVVPGNPSQVSTPGIGRPFIMPTIVLPKRLHAAGCPYVLYRGAVLRVTENSNASQGRRLIPFSGGAAGQPLVYVFVSKWNAQELLPSVMH